MARLSITRETLNALFARSGNMCAFPGCTEALVTSRNQFVGQICHIEAALPGGERYNPSSSDAERRSFANLLLLCYPHHVETDNTAVFDVQALRSMKREHELRYGQKPFKVNEAFLYHLECEMDAYWTKVSDANRNGHVIPELAVSISIGTPAAQQFADLYRSFQRLTKILGDLSTKDAKLNDEVRNHLARLGYDLGRL